MRHIVAMPTKERESDQIPHFSFKTRSSLIRPFCPFFPGCPMENLLRHQRSRFVDEKTADELIKKLPPYRPPGSSMQSSAGLSNLMDTLNSDDILEPQDIPPYGPYFDARRTRNVTALKGITTNLICRVKRLGDHKVRPICHCVDDSISYCEKKESS